MLRHLFKVCLSFVVLLCPAFSQAYADSSPAAKWKVEVTVAIANVRSSPSLTASVIARLPRGTVLEAEKAQDPWFLVTLTAQTGGAVQSGYIHSSVVRATEVPQPEPPAPPPAAADETAAPAPAPPREVPARLPWKKFEFSLLGGAGLTMVDIPAAREMAEKYFEEWSKFHWRVAAQALYRITPMMGVGLEGGFYSLYYFYYVYPYGYYTVRRENTITAFSLGGLADFRLGFFVIQTSAGIMFSEGSALFHLSLATGTEIPLGSSLCLPLMLRFDFAPGGPSPLAFIIGFKFKV
ncbi:MAG: hypothetical protein JW747_06820 [Candidatus Aminicenantes bacterium]|nr:hypothetical protein [Candidatus Aminicenantes bacterium]